MSQLTRDSPPPLSLPIRQIPHLLRVMPSMSPYISVTLVSAQGGKLAPGMFVAYRVTFRPEEQCDYYYELQCTSDQVTFSVPIMG